MTNYANIDDVKCKLQQETTTLFDDEVINCALTATTAFINNIVGDLHLGQHIEKVEICDFNCNGEIKLITSNIISLTKVNGITYTGVLGTDYNICGPRNRYLTITDLNPYLINLNFNCFSLEFLAGYNATQLEELGLPYLQASLVVDEITKQGNKTITSEKLGPKAITFSSEESKVLAENLLGNFISFIV